MEIKEKKKIDIYFVANFILSALIIFYFFYGFHINENSAGAGGYDHDFEKIWSNLILLKQDIFLNLNSLEYNDSRPPLSYILHILLNPFIDNPENFRLSNLFISLAVPVLLFYSIKQNYKYLSVDLVILYSLIITLSPYFRTTAYWSLGENYGIIFLLLSCIIYKKVEKNLKNYTKYQIYFSILFLCFSSSLIVYFDQKLVFIPFLILYLIYCLKITISQKFCALLFFFIFALPYFYLMYLWEGIIPPSAIEGRGVGSKLHLFNPGYCLSIAAIAIFPFILAKKNEYKNLREKILSKKNLIILFSFSIYIFFALEFGNFENLRTDGKGAIHKLFLLLFENTKIRLFFTIIIFYCSLIFLLFIFNKRKDQLIIFFLAFTSLFIFPFYQEYLDPLLYVLIFSFFSTRFSINDPKFVYIIFFYYSLFSFTTKYYYKIFI